MRARELEMTRMFGENWLFAFFSNRCHTISSCPSAHGLHPLFLTWHTCQLPFLLLVVWNSVARKNRGGCREAEGIQMESVPVRWSERERETARKRCGRTGGLVSSRRGDPPSPKHAFFSERHSPIDGSHLMGGGRGANEKKQQKRSMETKPNGPARLALCVSYL